jgi:hypothetical protein
MPESGGVLRSGPVRRRLISPDKWADGYPGPDVYVKELDVPLKFADEKGCLNQFRSDIEARDKQRNKALREQRRAHLLENMNSRSWHGSHRNSAIQLANLRSSHRRRFRFLPKSRVRVGKASHRRADRGWARSTAEVHRTQRWGCGQLARCLSLHLRGQSLPEIPGTYPARLISEETGHGAQRYAKYGVKFPDGKEQSFNLTGLCAKGSTICYGVSFPPQP